MDRYLDRYKANLGIGIVVCLAFAFGCGQEFHSADGSDASLQPRATGSAGTFAPGGAASAHGAPPESGRKSSESGMAANGDIRDDGAVPKLTPVADVEPDRYLIKNATVSVEVRDVRAVTASVIGGAKSRNGYISDLHETVDALGQRSVTFVVRVPAREFDTFLQGFEAQGKILDREVTAEDVTEAFVDTGSKLHNLHATEARLLSHLSRTGKLSDTLLVEQEINRVREAVDQLTGRLRFMAHRIAYSTFNVTVHETPHAQAITPPETFSAGKVISDSARSLIGFGQNALTVVIWLMMWSVVWLPPALIVGYMHLRRRRPSRNV